MKTKFLHKAFCSLPLWLALVSSFLISSNTAAQGKRVYIGSGSGQLVYPTAQATLNLQDNDTLFINAGTYSILTLKNIRASAGSKIYILNNGLVRFYNDFTCMDFANWENVEMKGNYVPSITYGFDMDNMLRGMNLTGQLTNVTFSNIKMTNVREYGIFLRNDALVYNGTNNPNSIFYNLKFLHFYAHTLKQTFLQVGDFGTLVNGFISMVRKLEVAYSHIENITDNAEILRLNRVVEANIHHNKILNTGFADTRHAGIIYLAGDGDVHHNYFNNNWGNAVRGHGFGLEKIGEVRCYNNIVLNSRKYSAFEANSISTDINATPYARYANYKFYNNTVGNLSAVDWQCSIVETYNSYAGTIEIKNNLGFNIERDKPHNPAQNYVVRMLNATLPDTSGNRYSRNSVDLGIISEDSCMLNAGSLAIDKGNTIALVTDDINGVLRPQNANYDIGAREYVTGVIFPVANAGTDQTITLPVNTANLNGSASFNPGGGVLTYAWTKLSGPVSFAIAGAATATPTISNLTQGVYEMKLVVTNAAGRTGEDIVLVTVNPEPIIIPIANAGADQTITLPTNSANLNGSASSNPGGGVLTYAWSKISGPVSFSITGGATATPVISSLTQGVYEMKLVVTNSQGRTAEDIVLITVNPEPIIIPIANAGPDQTITLPTNSANLNGSTSSNPGGGVLTYAWSKITGPVSFSITGGATATPVISSLTQGVYEMKLVVTNSQGRTAEDIVLITVNPEPIIIPIANAGPDQIITLPANSANLDGNASYNPGGGVLSYAWSKVAGPASFSITGSSTATPAISSLTQGVYELKLVVTNSQNNTHEDRILITVNPEATVTPVANAGADKTITLPTNSVTLDGSASFNPGGGAITYSWSKVSGPASFSITSANTATPSLSSLVAGVYQVKLVVTNATNVSSEDMVVVTVNPEPLVTPVANAGADQTITLPANSTNLDGTASYNPGGGALTYSWSKISGPASFNVTGTNSATPAISGLTQGVYQLKLVVTNGQGITHEDMVAITVNPEPLVTPVANAGADQTITLPVNSANLDGTASYNPGGGALTYSWSKLSGPASFNITGANSATPAINSLTQGVYQLKLIVTNGQGISHEDLVNITVNAAAVTMPVAIAGPDTTINFPGNGARLSGRASYATGTAYITTYNWVQVSGPTATLFTPKDIAEVIASNLEPGEYVFELQVKDNNNQTAADRKKVVVVNNFRFERLLTIYPNPCKDILNVRILSDSTGTMMARITSVSGIIVMTQSFEKSQRLINYTIPVASLPRGVYVLELIMNKKVQLQKQFIKQ